VPLLIDTGADVSTIKNNCLLVLVDESATPDWLIFGHSFKGHRSAVESVTIRFARKMSGLPKPLASGITPTMVKPSRW
jgi:hypothetical protein